MNLEIGTNDLYTLAPETVGSKTDDLAQAVRDQYSQVLGVCQVINRNIPQTLSLDCNFSVKAAVLRQYLYGSTKTFMAVTALCYA